MQLSLSLSIQSLYHSLSSLSLSLSISLPIHLFTLLSLSLPLSLSLSLSPSRSLATYPSIHLSIHPQPISTSVSSLERSGRLLAGWVRSPLTHRHQRRQTAAASRKRRPSYISDEIVDTRRKLQSSRSDWMQGRSIHGGPKQGRPQASCSSYQLASSISRQQPIV